MKTGKQCGKFLECGVGDFVFDRDVHEPLDSEKLSFIQVSNANNAPGSQIPTSGEMMEVRPFPMMIFKRGYHQDGGIWVRVK